MVLAHTWEAQPERCATLAETVGAARPGMSVRDKAQAMVAWIDGFVEQIGLKGLWNGKGVDSATPARLAKDVFAYMGRPVSQYQPVFDEDQVRRMFEEAMKETATAKERKR